MALLGSLAALAACDSNTTLRDPATSPRGDDAPPGANRAPDVPHAERSRSPVRRVRDLGADALCVTKGKLGRSRIEVPTFRAVAAGHAGDALVLRMLVHGKTSETRPLASGQERRQVGLKLRAQDGCNLIYVMWRLDPQPKLEVSMKHNPGQRVSAECGNGGYLKLTPGSTLPLPELEDGREHELRAEIVDDRLTTWVDGQIVWEGALPASAGELSGPAGLRSDNLDVEILAMSIDATDGGEVRVKCLDQQSD